MLVKWIEVDVQPGNRAAFHQDQVAWAPLSDAPGFVGQVGGWRTQSKAVVLGYWADRAAYTHFMEVLHDPIWAQASSAPIEGIDIAIWEAVLPMPGIAADLPNAMAVAGGLTWLDWSPDRDDAALMALAGLQPDLMRLPGHLGSLGTRIEAPLRYRVPSLWREPAATRPASAPSGWRFESITLEPEWTILPGGVEPVLR